MFRILCYISCYGTPLWCSGEHFDGSWAFYVRWEVDGRMAQEFEELLLFIIKLVRQVMSV